MTEFVNWQKTDLSQAFWQIDCAQIFWAYCPLLQPSRNPDCDTLVLITYSKTPLLKGYGVF